MQLSFGVIDDSVFVLNEGLTVVVVSVVRTRNPAEMIILNQVYIKFRY